MPLVQVTCYGNDGIGDDNDVWKIEVYEPDVAASDREDGRISLLTTRFRLIHKHMVCTGMMLQRVYACRAAV